MLVETPRSKVPDGGARKKEGRKIWERKRGKALSWLEVISQERGGRGVERERERGGGRRRRRKKGQFGTPLPSPQQPSPLPFLAVSDPCRCVYTSICSMPGRKGRGGKGEEKSSTSGRDFNVMTYRIYIFSLATPHDHFEEEKDYSPPRPAHSDFPEKNKVGEESWLIRNEKKRKENYVCKASRPYADQLGKGWWGVPSTSCNTTRCGVL